MFLMTSGSPKGLSRRRLLGCGALCLAVSGCGDDGRPTVAEVRTAAEAKLRAAWERMARGDGPAGENPTADSMANARQMGALLQLVEFNADNFSKLSDGSWRCDVTYFAECHGKTPNLRFRLKCQGGLVLRKDSGAWTVVTFDNVVGNVVAGGEGDPTWGTK